MDTAGWILVAVYLLVAAADWWAVAHRNERIEYVAKPGAMVVLGLLVLTFDVTRSDARPWFLGALALSLLGDVFLMVPRDLFIFGLVAFLGGHLAYVAGFAAGGLESSLVLPLVVVGVVALGIVRRLLTGPRMAPPLRLPVVIYVAAITVMASLALASGAVLAAAGALLFMGSDALIGWRRFVADAPWMPVVIIVLYHLGQLGIVTYLIV